MLQGEILKTVPTLLRSHLASKWMPLLESQLSTSIRLQSEVPISKKSSSRKLYVGQLPDTITTEQLRDYFSKWGVIKDCHFIKPRRLSKKGTSYGFVTFKSSSQADACLAEEGGHLILNHEVQVKRALNKGKEKLDVVLNASEGNEQTISHEEEDIVEDLVKDVQNESSKEEIKLDLLKQLLQIKSDTLAVTENKQTDVVTSSAKNLFSAFDDSTPRKDAKATTDRGFQRERRYTRLGLFNKTHQDATFTGFPVEGSSTYWFDHYYNQNLQNLYDRPSISNAYEEAIDLTKQGKIYTFPINNEQGLEEEKQVPFYKHVFLVSKLNEGGWCAARGPVRNFMVAVCSALSMNPYLTVTEKEEHINWFRDYFVEKRDLLQQLGINNT